MKTCCSKVICLGCSHANQIREIKGRLQQTCPFCREALPKTVEEHDKQNMKRAEANDPVAIRQKGIEQYNKGDYSRAFEYWTKAAELGDVEAHYLLSVMYRVCISMGMV